MNPAQGWYPDPRPGHTNLQAYWTGSSGTWVPPSSPRAPSGGVLDHRHRGGPGAVDGLPARPQASGISGRGRHDERSQPRRRARRNWLQASSSLSASALACASSCALNFSASCATSAGVKGAAFLASAESKTALSGTACGFAERWKVAQTITRCNSPSASSAARGGIGF